MGSPDQITPQEPVQRVICSICNRRVVRKGSNRCSRCTLTNQFSSLRSTLPGAIEQKQPVYAPPTDPPPPMESIQLPEGRTYNRKEVSLILGVSQTSIMRWERKGKTRMPLQHVASGKIIYTEEHLQELRTFMTQVQQIQQQAQPSEPAAQKQAAAKTIGRKTFKLNRGLERAVAGRLGRLSIIPGNLIK